MANTKKNNLTAIFDLGHSDIRLVTMDAELCHMRAFSVPTKGFSKGKVKNIQDFTSCIAQLSGLAQLSEQSVRTLVIIPSLHTRHKIQTLNHRTSGSYRSNDYLALIEAAIDSGTGDLDEVIDAKFLSLILDNHAIDPLSFTANGREISAQIQLATHPKLILADIVTAMNNAGIEVSEFRSTGFGLANAISILKPNSGNTVLLDIGHSSTTGILAVGGSIQSIFTVNAGSDHITRDLVAGTGLEYSEAEKLKISSGIKSDGLAACPTEANIQRVLKPRLSEILQLSFKNFALYAKSLDGGLLLVGAGSQISGLSPFVSKAIGASTPFICSLSTSSAEAFTKLKFTGPTPQINAGWLALLSHAKLVCEEATAFKFERESRPMSKLRPLWTWLSELSR